MYQTTTTMANTLIFIGTLIVILGSILQAESQSTSLFHYTSKEGYDGILKDGAINSSKRKSDARYGKGVYFTSIRPTADPDTIYVNNYDGKKLPLPEEKLKIEYYFEFDAALVTHAGGFKAPETRNIWVHLGQVDFKKIPFRKAGKSKDYKR